MLAQEEATGDARTTFRAARIHNEGVRQGRGSSLRPEERVESGIKTAGLANRAQGTRVHHQPMEQEQVEEQVVRARVFDAQSVAANRVAALEHERAESGQVRAHAPRVSQPIRPANAPLVAAAAAATPALPVRGVQVASPAARATRSSSSVLRQGPVEDGMVRTGRVTEQHQLERTDVRLGQGEAMEQAELLGQAPMFARAHAPLQHQGVRAEQRPFTAESHSGLAPARGARPIPSAVAALRPVAQHAVEEDREALPLRGAMPQEQAKVDREEILETEAVEEQYDTRLLSGGQRDTQVKRSVHVHGAAAAIAAASEARGDVRGIRATGQGSGKRAALFNAVMDTLTAGVGKTAGIAPAHSGVRPRAMPKQAAGPCTGPAIANAAKMPVYGIDSRRRAAAMRSGPAVEHVAGQGQERRLPRHMQSVLEQLTK